MNNRVYVLRRDTLEVLTSIGTGGRQAGQFFGVHSVATDSKGNLYTTETWEGKRLQKFVFKGVSRSGRRTRERCGRRPRSRSRDREHLAPTSKLRAPTLQPPIEELEASVVGSRELD